MALFKSQVITQASGSVGGLTYSRAKGGMYMRARAVPVNPQTARQNQVRTALTMYSQMWLDVLTAAQRAAWEVYAANVPVLNRLGDTIYLSGQNHYIRANVSRNAANQLLSPTVPLTSIAAAPTVFDLPMLTPPTTATYASATDQLALAFDDAADWVNDDGNALLVYAGRPRNATRNYFRGPYRLLAIVQGDATTPPASPIIVSTVSGAWPIAAGQQLKTRFMLSVGEATDQPTGLSAPAFLDSAVT